MSPLLLFLQAIASALGALWSALVAYESSQELGTAWKTIIAAMTALALFVMVGCYIWQIFNNA